MRQEALGWGTDEKQRGTRLGYSGRRCTCLSLLSCLRHITLTPALTPPWLTPCLCVPPAATPLIFSCPRALGASARGVVAGEPSLRAEGCLLEGASRGRSSQCNRLPLSGGSQGPLPGRGHHSNAHRPLSRGRPPPLQNSPSSLQGEGRGKRRQPLRDGAIQGDGKPRPGAGGRAGRLPFCDSGPRLAAHSAGQVKCQGVVQASAVGRGWDGHHPSLRWPRQGTVRSKTRQQTAFLGFRCSLPSVLCRKYQSKT